MLLYGLLHLAGYELSLDELKRFRQWGSLTPGHPEVGLTPGVEVSTCLLGQGAANAVGMAVAEAFWRPPTTAPMPPLSTITPMPLVSDGDLMEGISAEASSLAGHLGLGKLILLYDDNLISSDGPRHWPLAKMSWLAMPPMVGKHCALPMAMIVMPSKPPLPLRVPIALVRV
jgi:transketolase